MPDPGRLLQPGWRRQRLSGAGLGRRGELPPLVEPVRCPSALAPTVHAPGPDLNLDEEPWFRKNHCVERLVPRCLGLANVVLHLAVQRPARSEARENGVALLHAVDQDAYPEQIVDVLHRAAPEPYLDPGREHPLDAVLHGWPSCRLTRHQLDLRHQMTESESGRPCQLGVTPRTHEEWKQLPSTSASCNLPAIESHTLWPWPSTPGRGHAGQATVPPSIIPHPRHQRTCAPAAGATAYARGGPFRCG